MSVIIGSKIYEFLTWYLGSFKFLHDYCDDEEVYTNNTYDIVKNLNTHIYILLRKRFIK